MFNIKKKLTSTCLKWTKGLFGQNDKVTTLSTFELKSVTGINEAVLTISDNC